MEEQQNSYIVNLGTFCLMLYLPDALLDV